MPDFDNEIKAINAEIREATTTEASARAAADKLVSDMRESNVDLRASENFDKVDAAYRVADEAKDALLTARTQQARLLEIAGGKAEPATRAEAQVARTFAARLNSAESLVALRASGALRRGQSKVELSPIEDIITRDEMENSGLRLRTLFDNSADVGSGLLTPDYTGKFVEQLIRKVRYLDVITVGTTDTDTVDYVVENARTDAAAPTAYGTAVPESSYGFSHEQATVKRVGHFVPATKGILADAGQTKTLLNSRLISGLELAMESQAYSGDNSGENLYGLTHASLPTQALSTDTRFDAIHKAITKIVVACLDNVYPTHLLISPADYEKLVLDKDDEGRYRIADPTGSVNRPIWGLVPVVSTLIANGTPIVGDFHEAQTLWLREGISIGATDSHSDWFLKGLIAMMAETRAVSAVTRTAATCKVTGF